MIFNESILKTIRDLGLLGKINMEYSTEKNECFQEYLRIEYKNLILSIHKDNHKEGDYWTKTIWCTEPSKDDKWEECNLGLYEATDKLALENKTHSIERRYKVEHNNLMCKAKVSITDDEFNFDEDEIAFECEYEVDGATDLVYMYNNHLDWIKE